MNLYKLHTELGEYFVVATDSTAAEHKLKEALDIGSNGDGYGFSSQRKVTRIDCLAEEITKNDGPKGGFNLGAKFLLL